MAGFLSKIFGQKNYAIEDARRIYSKLMQQSRQTEFYGNGKVPDNYDGRIDLLTLHISVMLEALSHHDQQGQRLSQAIYDVMRDDFEIALREEGLSDTGIKRRIKPMMHLFFTRVKTYVNALKQDAPKAELIKVFETGLLSDGKDGFKVDLAAYTESFVKTLEGLSLGQLALAEFGFPKLS